MTPKEQEAADKLAAEQAAAEKAKAPKAKKKTIEELKSTDTVVVAFKNPVHVSDDGENSISKETTENHVKYEFWLSLAKDKEGRPKYSTVRGAKLVGYVDENGKVIKF